ncbi:hypothetical protein AQUCO_06100009v1 [Aquilegia coerulea]|uniref:Uncharacterized protein n=1 Tax=Aquilegia coerulea TaxID=218851 RepID=A0A2G5CD61_AQUCA|nr:hypothetical protein AQUCO_06100009v1 [Aquilegia coerulea]
MGSLMAGWDSISQDPKTVNLKRNKSLTMEEIDDFRRSHPTPEHQHHQHDEVTSPQSSNSPKFLPQGTNDPIDVAKAYKTNACANYF